MVRVLTFDDIKIWLYLQRLSVYSHDFTNSLHPTPEYICYFKFSEHTIGVYGELICDPENKPMIFKSMEEAEEYASKYLVKRFHNLKE